MAISGLLAVVLFYYGLNFFGGKKWDIAEIYLPGVPHTYGHWCWYTPWKSAPAKSGNSAKTPLTPKLAKSGYPDLAVQPSAGATEQPAAKPQPAPPPKAEAKPQASAETKAEAKAPDIALTKPETKKQKDADADDADSNSTPDAAEKPDFNSGLAPSATPESKLAPVGPKPVGTSQAKPGAKVEPKPEVKLEPAAPVPAKPQATTTLNDAPKPEVKDEPKPEEPSPAPAKPEKAEPVPAKPAQPMPKLVPSKPLPPATTAIAPSMPEKPSPAPAKPEPTPAVPAKPEKAEAAPAKPQATTAVMPPVKEDANALASAETKPPTPAPPASADLADLDAALKALRESFGSSPAELKPAGYETFCRVAEALAALSLPANDPQLVERKKEIESLVRKAASQPEQAKQIARRAEELLAAGLNAKGGILAAGTVTGVGVQNGLYGAAVRMDGSPKPVMVLSRQPFAIAKDDKVVILGKIVGDPAKNLPGYKGTQAAVVWAAWAIKLP